MYIVSITVDERRFVSFGVIGKLLLVFLAQSHVTFYPHLSLNLPALS
jgi:hypothetical protein